MQSIKFRLRDFLARCQDTEGEQAIIRVSVLNILSSIYCYSIPQSAHVNLFFVNVIIAIYTALGIGIIFELNRNPNRNLRRRIFTLMLDLLGCAFLMSLTNEYGVTFFCSYMWLSLAYGFRYGSSFLKWAQIASIILLFVVFAINPYWPAHKQIAAGFLFTLLYLPYLAGLILKRERNAVLAAEEANLAKSRFLATISHEIRTPLNAIIGLTDLLNHSQINSEQSAWIRTLSGSGEVLLALVNNVLDLARIEAGKITLENKPFRISETLNNLSDVFRAETLTKGLNLSYEIRIPDVDAVIGDTNLLNQVLINLVANAIKFTEKGEVAIRVSQISKTNNEVELLWEISDTGIGIPEIALNTIFDSFTQVVDPSKKRYGGTGLGTTIAKELVERMGGEIGVTSEMHKGSTFWFKLKFVVANQAHISSRSLTSAEALHSRLTPLRILLIEDNPTNRAVATKMLQVLGHNVCSVDSGAKALVYLACVQFDVILLDMEMPGLSGLDVLRKISCLREVEWKPPVFMLTANAISEAQEICFAAGAKAFLTKPITSRRLNIALLDVKKCTSENILTVDASPVDPERLAEQLILSNGDFSYVFELINGWCEDFAQSVQTLELAFNEHDIERMRYVLHNIESGAREIGAREIADACRAHRKPIVSTTNEDFLVIRSSLKNSYDATNLMLNRLKVLAPMSEENILLHA